MLVTWYQFHLIDDVKVIIVDVNQSQMTTIDEWKQFFMPNYIQTFFTYYHYQHYLTNF